MIEQAIEQIEQENDLSFEESSDVIDLIMQGKIENEIIGKFLLALKSKGEAVSEIAGAAAALRKHMTPIKTSRSELLDTCGTGGDGSDTFNISTAAAIVLAGCGVNVAKHGNRKVSSKTGSADALTELGVNVSAPLEVVEKCLDELGVCFCYAPLFHASMKNVGAVRKELGVPTIFNMLGPLCNPASADFQVLGVGKPHLREKIAAALQILGTEKAVVVHGTDQLCEISNAANTDVSVVSKSGDIENVNWNPESFGLNHTERQPLIAECSVTSAKIIKSVLDGEKGAARDIVLMNAAAGLWVSGRSTCLKECTVMCAESIDSGKANQVLGDLAKLSHA